jgi:hypothetical protein
MGPVVSREQFDRVRMYQVYINLSEERIGWYDQ